MPRVKSLSKSKVSLYTVHDLRSKELSDFSPSEKWTWVALRLLVADCPFRPVLCLTPGVPLTDEQIAKQLAVPLALWKGTKKKLVEKGKIVVSKSGIAVGQWYSPCNRREWEAAVPTDEEISKNQEERIQLCKVWGEITGHVPDPNNKVFMRNYNGRKHEGATLLQMETAVRTYLGIVTQGSLYQCRVMSISKALTPLTFWKLVKTNRPIWGATQSTLDYYNSLETDTLRGMARDIIKDYRKTILEYMRKEGLRNVFDIDFNKTKTCNKYLRERIGKYEDRDG
jgi:hypothetical protein